MIKVERHFSKKKIDDTKLKKLWVSRMSEDEIAKALGHQRWTVRRRAVKLGLPSSRRELWRTP